MGAYAASLIGMGIFIYSRNLEGEHTALLTMGGILILSGFIAFLISYTIFLYAKFIKH